MLANDRRSWDQALVAWAARAGRRSWGAVVLAVLLVVGSVVGLSPGVAAAEFEAPGTNGAQLDVNPSDELAAIAIVQVAGKGFPANALAHIFECGRSRFFLPGSCSAIAVAQTGATGGFNVSAKVTSVIVFSDEQQVLLPNVYDCATGGCDVVASTDPAGVKLTPTAEAKHHICFAGGVCTAGPTTTTTTTAPPPVPEWEPTTPMHTARENLAAVAGSDGRIYAMGGNDVHGVAMASAEVLDTCTKTWTSLPPMPTARTQLAAATGPDGRIYAIGGRDSFGGAPLATVEAYDPATNAWSPVSSLAVPRSDLAAVTGSDGRIYALGGTVSAGAGGLTSETVSIVEVYDPATKLWLPVPPPLTSRANFGAATGPDGRTYVFGGTSSTGLLPLMQESYSPGPGGAPGVWQEDVVRWLTYRFVPAGLAATTGPDGRIYAVGGAPPYAKSVRTTDIYDTATAIWSQYREPLTTPRANLGVATGRDGRIYAIGGTADPYIYDDPVVTDGPIPLSSVETLKVGTNNCPPPPPPPADFNGDGRSDVSVFRPSNGTWYVKDGTSLGWGADGDIPIPADYDGDRKVDQAIFRPATGLWAIHGSAGVDTFVTYGIGTDIPIPADYDGDGKTDLAIFRPDFGTWWMRYSSTGVDVAVTFGIGGDVPVPGDYDGDGRADLGIFRNGTWFTLPSAGGAYTAFNYGAPGDIPVPGDYDGDLSIDRAVFRPSDATWSLHHSSDGADETFTFGAPRDVPEPGDYNGDGVYDPATFRDGQWFIETGETYQWGIGSDIALPLPYAIRRTLQ